MKRLDALLVFTVWEKIYEAGVCQIPWSPLVGSLINDSMENWISVPALEVIREMIAEVIDETSSTHGQHGLEH